MKKILGLDIGSNSIGWALIDYDFNEEKGQILGMGSRIIPYETDLLKNFEQGLSASKSAERRNIRQIRRLKNRYKLRRERLIKVFKFLGWFPENFPEKFDNISQFNINSYVPFSDETLQEAKKIFNVEKLPIDWAIYYLRDKALKQQITLQELARIIYHLNQRRGFKSSRKEKTDANSDETENNTKKSIVTLHVESIEKIDDKSGNKSVYIIKGKTADGKVYEGILTGKQKPEFLNETIQFEITEIKENEGGIKYKLRRLSSSDWKIQLTHLENEIESSSLHVGQYHFQNLLNDRNYRVKEKIVSRSFYEKELEAIWNKQAEYYPELNDNSKVEAIAKLLYPHNLQKQKELAKSNLLNIIKDDTIYYQRPLKSQKRLIAECRLEKKNYIDDYNIQRGYKVAPKSSPLFQEFRIWQDINNLKIVQEESKNTDNKIIFDHDVTKGILNFKTKEKLFELFDSKTKITINDIFKTISEASEEGIDISKKTHSINFQEDIEFSGNETKDKFLKAFQKFNYSETGKPLLDDQKSLFELWHVFYSIEDEKVLAKVLNKRFNLPEKLATFIAELPPFKKEYAAYSSKALKKLLPLMRCGKYWNINNIHPETIERINKIISGELLPSFPENVQKIFQNGNFKKIEDFQGLPVFLASYVVYGIHSERDNFEKYESPDNIDVNKLIPNNSLRNPVVEQVVRETLNLVKDIWKHYTQPDEIHIELARDLKKNAKERQRISKVIKENENHRKRIKEILNHLKNANPNSNVDIEKLRLWEETANSDAKKSMPKISKNPTKEEIDKYIIWGEQNHISPYTGRVIPLSKLFTNEYEVEHIIPKSRFFDDSFANKTICEAAVNKAKGNLTAYEFIAQNGGQVVLGTSIKILTMEEYKEHIKKTFTGLKRKYFLTNKIPENFINRQINETRYINRKLGQLLFPFAKESIVFTTGQVTNELKFNWGLHRVWKEILLPRFQRLEKIFKEKLIEKDDLTNDIHFNIDSDIKRIDHRHHALDALVVAATTREHIRYLNSLESAAKEDWINVRFKLVKKAVRDFRLPWPTFTEEAKEKLQAIIVSYKNKLRILQRGYNKYQKWVFENGKWVKKFVLQDRSKLFSVRKSLFKEPLGIIKLVEYSKVSVNKAVKIQFDYFVNYNDPLQARIADKELRKKVNQIIKNCSFNLDETLKFLKTNPLVDNNGQKLKKIEILEFKEYAAKRIPIDQTLDDTKIKKIPYYKRNPLAKDLMAHLEKYNNNPKEAFTGEGLDELQKKLQKPVRKITYCEDIGNKKIIRGKLVEIDKGGNVFFVIYVNPKDPLDRKISEESSISIFEAVQHFMAGRTKNDLGKNIPGYKKIIFAPNDLVYVPDDGEVIETIDWTDTAKLSNKIYRVVSFSLRQLFLLPHYVAKPIIDRKEFGSQNKSERDLNEKMIKERCIKLITDRLGNIKPE